MDVTQARAVMSRLNAASTFNTLEVPTDQYHINTRSEILSKKTNPPAINIPEYYEFFISQTESELYGISMTEIFEALEALIHKDLNTVKTKWHLGDIDMEEEQFETFKNDLITRLESILESLKTPNLKG